MLERQKNAKCATVCACNAGSVKGKRKGVNPMGKVENCKTTLSVLKPIHALAQMI